MLVVVQMICPLRDGAVPFNRDGVRRRHIRRRCGGGTRMLRGRPEMSSSPPWQRLHLDAGRLSGNAVLNGSGGTVPCYGVGVGSVQAGGWHVAQAGWRGEYMRGDVSAYAVRSE